MSAVPGAAPVAIAADRARTGEAASALRGGAQLLVAGVVSLLANYLFLLGSGRLLGAADYGTLAALTGLLTVVLLPTGALQMATSREISRRVAAGEGASADGFSRALLLLGAKLTVPVLVVALALVLPLRALLNVGGAAPVALAFAALGGIFVYPIALGVVQGRQRFRALAVTSTAPMVARLALFVALAAAGMRLYGALGAVALAGLLAVVLGLAAIRGPLARGRAVAAPPLRPFLRYLGPVAVGLLGIALLTNVDILVVKARFPAEEAGVYAAASAFARIAFFLPATILGVLFPRTAARQARGQQSADILGRSVIVTVAFCAALAGAYALVGGPLIELTFGTEFASAGGLLVPFCLAMSCFSVANVLVGYHLSRGESRFAWVVAASVAVQVAVLATVPGSLRAMVWADLAIGVALLAAHEAVTGGSASALSAGYRRLALGAAARRATARVVAARGAVLEAAVALSGYSLLAVAATWPLARDLGGSLPGSLPNDGGGTAAWLWQLRHEDGYRLLGTVHHTLTGAPLGWDQGNALNFQWLLPYYPMHVLAGVIGDVAALNVCALAGLALSGAAMYALARYVGCGPLVSGWAGLVYLVFPWHLERVMAGHASLAHLAVFPLLLIAGIAWVRRPTDGRAALVALAVVAAWLTSGYFGAMALVALVGVGLAGAVVNRRALGWARVAGRAAKLWAMALVGSGALVTISLVLGGTTGIAIGRDAAELEFYGAHPADYLPDPATPVLGRLSERLGAADSYTPGIEGVVFPGALTVALAVLWLAVSRSRWARLPEAARVGTLTGGLVSVVALVFAMPSPAHLGPLSIHPLPSALLHDVLPSLRVPSRFVVVALAGGLVLAALGLAWVVERVGRRPWRAPAARAAASAVVVAAACAASFAELNVLPLEVSRVDTPPAQYAALETIGDGVLAEYPLVPPGAVLPAEYVYWQRAHGRPLLNGAGVNTEADSVRRMLVDPTRQATAASLAFLGVTAVITRPTTLDWETGTRDTGPVALGQGFERVASVPGDVGVWKVTAAPAPALVVYGPASSVAEPLPRDADGETWYPLTRDSVAVDLIAREQRLLRLSFSLQGPVAAATLSGGGPDRRIELGGPGTYAVVVAVPRGRSRLVLTVEPRREPGADVDALAISAPRLAPARPADRAGALQAVSITPEHGL
jgi:O-antigen/teichoic acid export membrane protein